MKKSFLLLSLLSFIFLNSCGEMIEGVGAAQPETRSVSPFNEIKSDGAIDIRFRLIKDGVDKVVVTAQENLLPIIITKVEDETLHIYTEKSYSSTQKLTIDVYGRALNSAVLNGSGDFTTDGKIETQKFYLGLNGSGDANVKLKCKSIEVNANGSGDVAIEGSTDYLEAELNGSGDLSAIELRTFNAEIESNGSGDSQIYAKESLEIELNGSGDVSYKGRAKIDKTINGSGDVFEL